MDWLSYFAGRRVLVTGHTGFKGAWLSAWLQSLGAEVSGFALQPDGDPPGVFIAAGVAAGMNSTVGDVRDLRAVRDFMVAVRPEIVFHLAAQSLVLASYQDPVATFATNVMGTVNVLEAARHTDSVRAVVNITSDKCYRSGYLERPYREDDPFGGDDPYSASKGAAEIVTHAYRKAFFGDGPPLASARAGNVIGGGDWAANRLVPDMVRGLAAGNRVEIRRPSSVRPWQFVLEPLSGYLRLAYLLCTEGKAFATGWNFGPAEVDQVPVREIAGLMAKAWGRGDDALLIRTPVDGEPWEAPYLRLDSTAALTKLGWRPVLSVRDAVGVTAEWYRAFDGRGTDMQSFTRRQIAAFTERSR